MTRVKMLVAGGVIAAGLTGALVGCATADNQSISGPDQFTTKTIRSGGRDIPCIVWITEGAKAGGISCDWSNRN